MLDNNRINFILIKAFKSQNYVKYIDVIYYHINRLVENRKLITK